MAAIQELEIDAILVGSRLATDYGFRNIWVETDSLLVIQVISSQIKCPWRKKQALYNIHCLMSKIDHWKITHVWREANRGADFLSKIDCPIKGGNIPVHLLPQARLDIAEEDFSGTLYPRMK
ncbi:uncharacterized protein LOC143869880 [Tasmannia lanceolata]|uniref:uncharacterized protein LOC143869880 n=1 Tax=Tasmannia lanceolata TaxID=3420 RepID=UPI0040632310